MTILELISVVSSGASITSCVDSLRKYFPNSTPEALFKESFGAAVKQIAPSLADIANPKTIEVDYDTFDNVIASLKDIDIAELALLEKGEKLAKITTRFHKCIILPGHQLTDSELLQRLQPVLERTLTNFYERLSRNQQAANHMMLGSHRMQLEGQEHLIEQNAEIQHGIQGLDAKLTNLSNNHPNVSISDAVETAIAKEHQSEIDDIRDLLEKYRPKSALEQFEKLKERIWAGAVPIVKFRILTNMAKAQLDLNNEPEAAKLLIEAFQYNPEDETALSNRAVGYFLLGETEKATEDAQRTLEKNPTNTNAHVVRIHISASKEPLEKIIATVPDYLQETPEIAYTFSDIAREQGDPEEARKWCEIMVTREQGNTPDFKAALATILIEQVLVNRIAMYTKQLDDSQKEQLKQAVALLTEAWTCVADTELRAFRVDWIINRSTARHLLGESEAAIKDLDAAIEIEPKKSTLFPTLLKNRAILSFEQGETDNAVEFLERIQSIPETFEAQVIIAALLFAGNRFDEAITILTNLLERSLPSELQEDANRWLIRNYIAVERFEEAKQISKALRESSPRNIQNLVMSVQVFEAIGESDEVLSLLEEACEYAQNSDVFPEIVESDVLLETVELAKLLYSHERFQEAAVLYEKLADTSQDSQLTQWLLKSYYNAGQAGKALEICRDLRAKYGPLENITEMEVMIYEEIGDTNQAEAICNAYLNEFPDDINMQIRLGFIYHRASKTEEIEAVLESFSDFKNFPFLENLPMEICFQLASLHQISTQPKKALQIMYETRRTYFENSEAHLKYIGLFYQVDRQIREALTPSQVQPETVVHIDDISDQPIIIEERHDADIKRNERNITDRLVQRILGKSVNAEFNYGKTPFGPKVGKIVDIKSKYVHALQESFQRFPALFPDADGLWSIELDEPSADSSKTDSGNLQKILALSDKQHEASLQIENAYKEHLPPIGVFMDWTERNVLDVWSLLIKKPDLGIRCCVGDAKERSQALNLLDAPKPKLVVDIISLITLHCLEAADTVVKGFGKLAIAQSTVDSLLQIIHEREGIWAQRKGITIEKQGNRYVRHIIDPEDVRLGIERLRNLIKWIRENCEVLPCTAALQMNQLRKRELSDRLQPLFLDSLLIASQPGYVLLSDDERLRAYATTSFNSDAETNFHIDGVWTQVVLEHCVKTNLLDKAEYDKMAIRLVCSHYYHTAFDEDTLMESAKQAAWHLTEPYNSLVQALGRQRSNLQSALSVAVNFLFLLWQESIPSNQCRYLTFGLLAGLTSGRDLQTVLNQLADRIQKEHILSYPVEERIVTQIGAYAKVHPTIKNSFDFLAEDDIRIKGTRIGIETVLYESLHRAQTPEEIVQRFDTLTLAQVYETILYYLQNPEKVRRYLEDNLEYGQTLREVYEKNPPPGVVRSRQLKAETQAVSDIT